jgi:hypothetical protein
MSRGKYSIPGFIEYEVHFVADFGRNSTGQFVARGYFTMVDISADCQTTLTQSNHLVAASPLYLLHQLLQDLHEVGGYSTLSAGGQSV